jgi:hypothetical protein
MLVECDNLREALRETNGDMPISSALAIGPAEGLEVAPKRTAAQLSGLKAEHQISAP